MYRFWPNFRAGLSWMPRDRRASPVWNWRLKEGSSDRPALILGQSTAWPSSKVPGAAYSLSLAQQLNEDWSAYVSLSYAPSRRQWHAPAGVNWSFQEGWVARLLWDGINVHPAVLHTRGAWSIGLILLDGSDPTLATSLSF